MDSDASELAEKGVSWEEGAKALKDLATGLRALHSHKKRIIHWDIKPANILIKDGVYKIGDVGLAKMDFDTMKANTHCGTRSYLAPEILAN